MHRLIPVTARWPAAWAAAAAAAFLITGCSSSPAGSSGGSDPLTGQAISPSPVPDSPAASTPAASPTPVAPSPSPSTCAQRAASTFLHLTAVTNGLDGALTLTASPATMVCGGMDDFHFDVSTTTVTAHVNPGASISVFSLTAGHPENIGPYQLASYLATDDDTRVFLVTGPLSRITGLAEQFHP